MGQTVGVWPVFLYMNIAIIWHHVWLAGTKTIPTFVPLLSNQVEFVNCPIQVLGLVGLPMKYGSH